MDLSFKDEKGPPRLFRDRFRRAFGKTGGYSTRRENAAH
jgi:hypothetical protein